MIFTIPFIAFWIACIIGIPQRIRFAFNLKSFKPFTCSKCMGFWLALLWQIKVGFSYESLAIIPLSSLTAYFIEWFCAIKLKMKLNL